MRAKVLTLYLSSGLLLIWGFVLGISALLALPTAITPSAIAFAVLVTIGSTILILVGAYALFTRRLWAIRTQSFAVMVFISSVFLKDSSMLVGSRPMEVILDILTLFIIVVASSILANWLASIAISNNSKPHPHRLPR